MAAALRTHSPQGLKHTVNNTITHSRLAVLQTGCRGQDSTEVFKKSAIFIALNKSFTFCPVCLSSLSSVLPRVESPVWGRLNTLTPWQHSLVGLLAYVPYERTHTTRLLLSLHE
jgi:hypothetical protein